MRRIHQGTQRWCGIPSAVPLLPCHTNQAPSIPTVPYQPRQHCRRAERILRKRTAPHTGSHSLKERRQSSKFSSTLRSAIFKIYNVIYGITNTSQATPKTALHPHSMYALNGFPQQNSRPRLPPNRKTAARNFFQQKLKVFTQG